MGDRKEAGPRNLIRGGKGPISVKSILGFYILYWITAGTSLSTPSVSHARDAEVEAEAARLTTRHSEASRSRGADKTSRPNKLLRSMGVRQVPRSGSSHANRTPGQIMAGSLSSCGCGCFIVASDRPGFQDSW